MINCKKTAARLLSVLLVIIMAAAAFSACKLTNDGPDPTEAPKETEAAGTTDPATKVVLTSKNVDMTLYDFGQAFYNSQYFQYYMYGMMTPSQYCDAVIEELSNITYLLNAAIEEGVVLDDDENAELDRLLDEQLADLVKRYSESADENETDKEAAGMRLLEEDLAVDGLDYETFKTLARKNLGYSGIVNKYYEIMKSKVDVTDAEVEDYIAKQTKEIEDMTMLDFSDLMSDYNAEQGPFPVFIKDDCFSVNHIYMSFESSTDDEGNLISDTTSRKNDEAVIEAKLPELADFDAFMELEKEFGEDPGMDNDMYRENGYFIHPDLEDSYFAGFVYAAMNLHEGQWDTTLENDPDTNEPFTPPELTFFTLADGTKVVKVYTGSGVHYIIVNKEYKKGAVAYEKGDEYWEAWKDTVTDTKLNDVYDELSEEWKEKYPIEVDTETIKAKYAPGDNEK